MSLGLRVETKTPYIGSQSPTPLPDESRGDAVDLKAQDVWHTAFKEEPIATFLKEEDTFNYVLKLAGKNDFQRDALFSAIRRNSYSVWAIANNIEQEKNLALIITRAKKDSIKKEQLKPYFDRISAGDTIFEDLSLEDIEKLLKKPGDWLVANYDQSTETSPMHVKALSFIKRDGNIFHAKGDSMGVPFLGERDFFEYMRDKIVDDGLVLAQQIVPSKT